MVEEHIPINIFLMSSKSGTNANDILCPSKTIIRTCLEPNQQISQAIIWFITGTQNDKESNMTIRHSAECLLCQMVSCSLNNNFIITKNSPIFYDVYYQFVDHILGENLHFVHQSHFVEKILNNFTCFHRERLTRTERWLWCDTGAAACSSRVLARTRVSCNIHTVLSLCPDCPGYS